MARVGVWVSVGEDACGGFGDVVVGHDWGASGVAGAADGAVVAAWARSTATPLRPARSLSLSQPSLPLRPGRCRLCSRGAGWHRRL